jgi:hypothetical protein
MYMHDLRAADGYIGAGMCCFPGVCDLQVVRMRTAEATRSLATIQKMTVIICNVLPVAAAM